MQTSYLLYRHILLQGLFQVFTQLFLSLQNPIAIVLLNFTNFYFLPPFSDSALVPHVAEVRTNPIKWRKWIFYWNNLLTWCHSVLLHHFFLYSSLRRQMIKYEEYAISESRTLKNREMSHHHLQMENSEQNSRVTKTFPFKRWILSRNSTLERSNLPIHTPALSLPKTMNRGCP